MTKRFYCVGPWSRSLRCQKVFDPGKLIKPSLIFVRKMEAALDSGKNVLNYRVSDKQKVFIVLRGRKVFDAGKSFHQIITIMSKVRLQQIRMKVY
jgi:hypothetical protein